MGALFCCFCFLLAQTAIAGNRGCRSNQSDESARIEHVHDGDTVWLADGRKVRIIGINTPELARDEHPAEPLALEARNRLRQLLGKSPRVRLRHGREKTDRYGRLLAHLFLPDGRNISEQLLRDGLAYTLTVPPNLWQTDCYQRAEQAARRQQKGLWDRKHFQPLQVNDLSPETRGFHIVRGRLTRIGKSRKAIWLNFGRQFAVRIVRDDLPYFNNVNFEKLKGKRLEVRGWVQYHNHQSRMRIRHAAALQILP